MCAGGRGRLLGRVVGLGVRRIALNYRPTVAARLGGLKDRPWFVYLDSCTERARGGRYDIIASDPLPLSQWKRRASTRISPMSTGDVLAGIGGGSGRYTGRVCVLRDPADMAKLEPGDVLVAPFTDAAWTPLFLLAGAVVVDVGALNSHAVVVSRELGIPSVLSVTTGTTQLVDGMDVTVDGTAGTVTVVATEGAVTV